MPVCDTLSSRQAEFLLLNDLIPRSVDRFRTRLAIWGFGQNYKRTPPTTKKEEKKDKFRE